MTLTAKLYISVQERQSDPPYLGLVDACRLHALLKSCKKKKQPENMKFQRESTMTEKNFLDYS